ncbi:hypothetical protein F511_18848 [Dorcoceras hygrometricum]|uniref:Uncharacterized protein n=1 Tax=Dorcoceras hygrometricum TaxID=472368 RepID=A0A2Z7DDA4_9LAMI|nr:hypothetical protein F511_18848 [Dorcoceras hygrometricum]
MKSRITAYKMVSMKNPLAAILDSNRFTGLNYQDWLRNLNLVLASEKLLYTIEKCPPEETPADISPEELITLNQWRDDEVKARCYVMASMSNEMQQRFEKTKENCDVLSMQIDSDLVIYRTTLVRTFQVVTICRVDKSEVLCVLPVTLAMSLFDLQDVRIAIGSIATLDLPMVVDLIGIYGLKGPYVYTNDDQLVLAGTISDT